MYSGQGFSPTQVGFPPVRLMVSFAFISFMRPHLLIVGLNSQSEWSPIMKATNFSFGTYTLQGLACIFPNSYNVSRFTLKYLTHLELNFLQGDRYRSNLILQCVDIKCFPKCIFWHLCPIIHLYLGLLFCSTNFHICVYASAMIFYHYSCPIDLCIQHEVTTKARNIEQNLGEWGVGGEKNPQKVG